MNARALKFKGSYTEIGKQVGLLYKKWGHTYSDIPLLADQYYSQQLKIYEKFYPQYLEFLEGLAKGIRLNKDKILKFSLTSFLSADYNIVARRCSIFAANNKHGVFIGRNYDWFESSELTSKFIQYDYLNNKAFSIKGISDMGTTKPGKLVSSEDFYFFIEDAWNNNLYIGLTGAPGKKTDIGIATPHVVQLIAEKCKKVDEAISILESLPIPNSQIYTLADKQGNLAVVEKSLEGGSKIRRSDSFIIATNHFNHEDLVYLNAKVFEKVPWHSTFGRYHYLEAHLVASWQKLDFSNVHPLMNKPPVLENWRGVKMGDTITDWTLALNLQNEKYRINFAPLLKNNVFVAN
ncbi:hypothetical protein A3D76_06640 [Candidatus Roizmanbacteria bacterium RIFCSPHIGHO2_02_FULL_37_9b]|nr:MAG: hypothetical protein A3D76_06640 [Candidatus Roizmanbacteria bacterium RIFCSPHIGHO2_02_FULL_37_9b]